VADQAIPRDLGPPLEARQVIDAPQAAAKISGWSWLRLASRAERQGSQPGSARAGVAGSHAEDGAAEGDGRDQDDDSGQGPWGPAAVGRGVAGERQRGRGGGAAVGRLRRGDGRGGDGGRAGRVVVRAVRVMVVAAAAAS
jgi:hypothetical protein